MSDREPSSSSPEPPPAAGGGGPHGAGPLLVGLGLFVVLIGLVVWTGALNWFGRLPGDIRYEGQSTRVYVPLVSMLLVSIVLSAISFVVRRFF